MKHILNRREMLTRCSSGFGLLALQGMLGSQSAQAAKALVNPKAKSVIFCYMSGGASHIDTFDPKPGAETGGPTQAIKTNAAGVQLAENLPLLANHADKIAVVRGLTSTKGAHQQGNYFMHTSYAQRATIRHPSMGAWMTRLDNRFNPTLPGAVVV